MQFNTKLMNEPKAYQVTFRLNQLRSIYGKDMTSNCVFFGDNGYNPELGRHVNNLLLTYGTKLVFEIAEIIFKTSRKKSA